MDLQSRGADFAAGLALAAWVPPKDLPPSLGPPIETVHAAGMVAADPLLRVFEENEREAPEARPMPGLPCPRPLRWSGPRSDDRRPNRRRGPLDSSRPALSRLQPFAMTNLDRSGR